MITLITGPMFSGKSSEMIRQVERKHIAGKKILYVRPTKDTREFVARGYDNAKLSKLCKVTVVDNITSLVSQERLDLYDAIFVDEFFLFDDCRVLCLLPIKPDHKQDIIFGGLLATSEALLWPQAIEIIPYCDEIIKLNAVCTRCGSEHANYSYFKGTKNTDVVIGDGEYEALCRSCYRKAKGMV